MDNSGHYTTYTGSTHAVCDTQSDCLAECEANYVINNAIINLIIILSYYRVCHQQLQLQRRLHAR